MSKSQIPDQFPTLFGITIERKLFVFLGFFVLGFHLPLQAQEISEDCLLCGKYYISPSHADGYREFEFFEDGTFLFVWSVGLLSGETPGTWKLDGEHIVLNSYKQPPKENEPLFRILEEKRESSDSLKIFLVNSEEEKDTLPFYCVAYDTEGEKLFEVGNLDGKITISKDSVDHIEIISMLYHPAFEIELDSQVSTYVFEPYPEDIFYQYFSDSTMVFSKGVLYDPPFYWGKRVRPIIRPWTRVKPQYAPFIKP